MKTNKCGKEMINKSEKWEIQLVELRKITAKNK